MELQNVRPKSWVCNEKSFPDYNGIKTDILAPTFEDVDWFPTINVDPGQVKEYIKSNISVSLGPGRSIEIPYQLKELADEIEKSKYMLDLKEDWDGEESKGYESSTWERAIRLIVDYFIWTLDEYGKTIDSPRIYHGPDGSIDILWENPGYRLLINIPEDQNLPATFYGDDYKLEQIEGRFDPQRLNMKIFHSITNF